MLSQLKRLASRKSTKPRNQRRRSLLRSLEQLENRQLLAVDLDFSTYFASNELDGGVGEIAQDVNGNAYVASYQITDAANNEYESYLSKISSDGEMLWSQVLDEYAYDVAVDTQGFVYLVALTETAGLSLTPDAHQTAPAGGFDLYVTVLDGNAIDSNPSTLSSDELVFASYLGGSGSEDAFPIDLTVDDHRGIYLTTRTNSPNFPTTNQPTVDDTYGGGSFDGTLSYFKYEDGYSLEYSTYIGGAGTEFGVSVDLDDSGLIHFAVVTESTDLNTTADAANATILETRSVYLARMTTSGNLEYGSYVGKGIDGGVDIAATPDGATYLFGRAGTQYPVTDGVYSTDIKTFPYQGSTGSLWGNYVAVIDSAGKLAASTRFHINDDVTSLNPADIELDGDELVISGAGLFTNPAGESYVMRFNSDLSVLLDSTSIGGSNEDSWYGMSNIVDGDFYIGGFTKSDDFPTTPGAPDDTYGGENDGFLVRYALGESAEATVTGVTQSEGSTNNVAAVVLSLADPWPTEVSVDYRTIDGTGVAGEDYLAASGTLVIPAGATSASIDITILGDALPESDESFTVELSNFVGIGLNSTTPKVTIIDDDFAANDDFDNGTPDGGSGAWLGDWSLGSNTGFTTSSTPNDGVTHAIIQRRGSLTRQVDTAGIANLSISFASKLRSFENSDRAYVQVSSDGSNWTTLKTFVNGEDDNTYRNYSFDVPFETDTLWIRFQGDMSSSRYDYWYVDSLSVTGSVASQPPVAVDDSGSTAEDQAVTIDILANDSDPDGDALSIASVTQPGSGTATIVGGQVEYTPNANFNGSDSFSYTINDTAGNSATATVNVTITPVNDAPVSVDDSVTTAEDTSITISVLNNDSDVDGDALGVVSANDGANGFVVVNADNTLTYTPDAGFFGSDSFSYTITDGNGETSTSDVSITVEEQNDPPVAVGDSATTNEDLALLINVLTNDSDPDGDSLSIQSVTQPANGSATIVGGQVQYSPDVNFNGSDSFSYTIVDTAGNTATATVNVTITAVNDAPVASGESYSLDQDTTLNVDAPGVLENDTDVEGDALTAALVTGPASGSLTLNSDGSFSYTPTAGFVGSDSFTYQAVDTSGATSDAVTVNLQVDAVATGPKLSHGVVGTVTSNWQTVSLSETYDSAVIVATPRYNSTNSGPGVVRIRNVTATSFEVRVDNVGSSAFSGGIHFIAMEEGVYDVPGEYKLEAVKVDATTTSGKSAGWQIGSQGYQQSYSNPVVVGQVMSANDEDWSVFWSSSNSRTSPATSSALNIGKHVGEDTNTARATETLGYFVIEATGSGAIDGLSFSAGVGTDSIRGVDNGTYRYSNVTPSGATTAVLSTAGMDGGDGGWAALMGSTPLPANGGWIDLSVDEDQIRDTERKHTTEQVAYFVIGEATGEGEASTQAAPLISVHRASDVNGDGYTSPLDVLQVINSLNASTTEVGDLALDTNGDGYLSALDALLVVNHLNASSAPIEAEASNSAASFVDGYFGDLEADEKESLFGLSLI